MDCSVVNTVKCLTLLELDLCSEVSTAQIRSQYRKLCLIYHPDQANARYSDGVKFNEITEAQNYLLNNIDKVNYQIRNGFSTTTQSTSDTTRQAQYQSSQDTHTTAYGTYQDSRSTRSKNNASSKEPTINKTGLKWSSIVLTVIVIICIIVNSISESSASLNTEIKNTNTTNSTYAVTPTHAPLSMPSNGHVFYCANSKVYSTIKITNKGSDNYYLKFVDSHGNKIFSGMVRAYSNYTFDIPAMYLELRMAIGDEWYGEHELFGDDTIFMKDEEPYYFIDYEYTLEFDTYSSLGDTMDVEYIDPSEF